MSIFPQLIFDTNVLTYLYKLGLLDTCLEAVEHPYTFDLIRDVELKDMVWASIVREKVDVLSLDPKQMTDAYAYRSTCKRLTIYDAGLIILARIFEYPVFTEDKLIIHELERLHLNHVTLLDVLKKLVSTGSVSPKAGIAALDAISSELLPGRYPDECTRLRNLFST